jgi:hypothetical protein
MNRKKMKSIVCCLWRNDLRDYIGCYEHDDGHCSVFIRFAGNEIVVGRRTAKLLAKRINQYLEATK